MAQAFAAIADAWSESPGISAGQGGLGGPLTSFALRRANGRPSIEGDLLGLVQAQKRLGFSSDISLSC